MKTTSIKNFPRVGIPVKLYHGFALLLIIKISSKLPDPYGGAL